MATLMMTFLASPNIINANFFKRRHFRPNTYLVLCLVKLNFIDTFRLRNIIRDADAVSHGLVVVVDEISIPRWVLG